MTLIDIHIMFIISHRPFIYICVYIYIYIFFFLREREGVYHEFWRLFSHTNWCTYNVHNFTQDVYIYIYIYIWRERESLSWILLHSRILETDSFQNLKVPISKHSQITNRIHFLSLLCRENFPPQTTCLHNKL